MMAEDWIKLKSTQERSVMTRMAQTSRIIIICAYLIMGIGCVFIIFLPLFGVPIRIMTNITDLGRPLPFPAYYTYDITNNMLQYLLTFVSQVIYIILAVMSYTGIDNFLGLLIFHICGQLDILKERLTHLGKYTNIPDTLKSCVVKHVRLLRFYIFWTLFIIYCFLNTKLDLKLH